MSQLQRTEPDNQKHPAEKTKEPENERHMHVEHRGGHKAVLPRGHADTGEHRDKKV
jgi:hypothetical protein